MSLGALTTLCFTFKIALALCQHETRYCLISCGQKMVCLDKVNMSIVLVLCMSKTQILFTSKLMPLSDVIQDITGVMSMIGIWCLSKSYYCARYLRKPCFWSYMVLLSVDLDMRKPASSVFVLASKTSALSNY